MSELFILVIGIPLLAWLLMHAIRLSLKAVEFFERREK